MTVTAGGKPSETVTVREDNDVLGIAPIDRLGELTWLGPLSVLVFGLMVGLVVRAASVPRFDLWMLLLTVGTFAPWSDLCGARDSNHGLRAYETRPSTSPPAMSQAPVSNRASRPYESQSDTCHAWESGWWRSRTSRRPPHSLMATALQAAVRSTTRQYNSKWHERESNPQITKV